MSSFISRMKIVFPRLVVVGKDNINGSQIFEEN